MSSHEIRFDINDELLDAMRKMCKKHNIKLCDILVNGFELLKMISEAHDRDEKVVFVDKDVKITNVTGLFIKRKQKALILEEKQINIHIERLSKI